MLLPFWSHSVARRCAQRLLQSEPGELLRRAIVISVEVSSIPDTIRIACIASASPPPPQLQQTAISTTIYRFPSVPAAPEAKRPVQIIILQSCGLNVGVEDCRASRCHSAHDLQHHIAGAQEHNVVRMVSISSCACMQTTLNPLEDLGTGPAQDAVLHPQLPLLVFLMAAVAKGYTLGRTLASACLRIVHDLAVVPIQDSIRAGALLLSSVSAAPGSLHCVASRLTAWTA